MRSNEHHSPSNGHDDLSDRPTRLHGGAGARPAGVTAARGSLSEAPTNVGPWTTPPSFVATAPTDGGRYEQHVRLSEGGMGIVWKAFDKELRRWVALKRLRPELSTLATVQVSFQAEAVALARIAHDHVVQIFDRRRDDQGEFLVMEYVAAGSLAERLRSHGRLPQRDALRLVEQVCLGLEAAHRVGVIHRDIKPANILLTSDGKAKLIDFGIARLLRRDDAGFAGATGGTSGFVAPELRAAITPRQAAERATPASDQYALAATLYQLLTGRPPDVIEAHRVDGPLRPILLQALQFDPAGRFESVGQFREALHSVLKASASAADRGEPRGDLPERVSPQESARRLGTPLEITHPLDFVWRLVPEGWYFRGAADDEAESEVCELPRHECVITRPFYLSVFPVTQSQYERVMGCNPSHFRGDGRLPVEQVSWDDVHEFLRRLARLVPDARFRLPTEAEWEYACRAGTTSPFSFGAALDGAAANCDGSHPYGTLARGPFRQATSRVGSYPPNPWGFCDMHGNVWEWCLDYFEPRSYPLAGVEPAHDPRGPAIGVQRALRGGSWNYFAANCRSASRLGCAPQRRLKHVGFRLVREV